jgi:hypothetical protein
MTAIRAMAGEDISSSIWGKSATMIREVRTLPLLVLNFPNLALLLDPQVLRDVDERMCSQLVGPLKLVWQNKLGAHREDCFTALQMCCIQNMKETKVGIFFSYQNLLPSTYYLILSYIIQQFDTAIFI